MGSQGSRAESLRRLERLLNFLSLYFPRGRFSPSISFYSYAIPPFIKDSVERTGSHLALVNYCTEKVGPRSGEFARQGQA